LSQAKAQAQVDHSRSAVATASSEIDEHGAQVAKLQQAARANHDEYEIAVRICCNELDLASQLGIQNSMLGAIGHVFGEVGGAILAPVEWVGGKVEEWAQKTAKDVVNLAEHPSWEALREVLNDAKAPLEVVGAAALIGVLVLNPELAIFAYAVEAGGGVTLATVGIDTAMTTGDAYEAARGDKKAQSHLLEDGTSLAADALPLGKVFKEDKPFVHIQHQASKEEKVLASQSKSHMVAYKEGMGSGYKGWATRYENQRSQLKALAAGSSHWKQEVERSAFLKDRGSKYFIHAVGESVENKTAPTTRHPIVFPAWYHAL
jgi:hypothetical protein